MLCQKEHTFTFINIQWHYIFYFVPLRWYIVYLEVESVMHYTNFVLNHREVGLQWQYYKTNLFFYQHNTVDSINLLKRKMTLNPSYSTVSCVPLYTPEKYKARTDFKLLRNWSSNFLYIGITLSGFFLKCISQYLP